MKIETTSKNPRSVRVVDDNGIEISNKSITAIHVAIEPHDIVRATVHLTPLVRVNAAGEFLLSHPQTGQLTAIRAILFEDGTTWAAKPQSTIEEMAYAVCSDTLSFIGYYLTPETFEHWSVEQRTRVADYAACVRLNTSGGGVKTPEKPAELVGEPWTGSGACLGITLTVL